MSGRLLRIMVFLDRPCMRVTSKVALQVKSGSKNYLMDEEETSLVDFLVGCAKSAMQNHGRIF